MLCLYTFCVDIGRHSVPDLLKCLELFIVSLESNVPAFELIVYSNFVKTLTPIYAHRRNISLREYYDNTPAADLPYRDRWLNLSYNKIHIYKDLYDETHVSYSWIDLDTIVTGDITYVASLNNCFIDIGGNCTRDNPLFSNNQTYHVKRSHYIQGNFWKLSIELYHALVEISAKLKRERLTLRYDLQDLFNYAKYHTDCQQKVGPMVVLGRECNTQCLYGLCVWSPTGDTHATMAGLCEFYVRDGKLFSHLYPDREIHIVSFTFMTMKKLWHTLPFQSLVYKDQEKRA
jgi:hypothetical protein